MEFFFPPVILKELRVSNGVDTDVSRGSMGGSLVEGVMTGGISSVGEIEIF